MLTVIDCHSSGIYLVILLSLLLFSVELTVSSLATVDAAEAETEAEAEGEGQAEAGQGKRGASAKPAYPDGEGVRVMGIQFRVTYYFSSTS
jgi:hypothetical protein